MLIWFAAESNLLPNKKVDLELPFPLLELVSPLRIVLDLNIELQTTLIHLKGNGRKKKNGKQRLKGT